MTRASRPAISATMLTVAVLTLTACEPDNSRPSSDNTPVSQPIPLASAPPVQVSNLPEEISAPITPPSNAPLPIEGDTLTSGQVLDRLRARLSTPTCIVGPNNTRWRHKYAGYPQHFADEVLNTLPMMLVVLDELERRKMPGEFALIPIVESWYQPDTRSFGGAVGMWQMLDETSRNNGATVISGYDGRLSALDSTDAALTYLGKLQMMFNDWRLTAMAYNSGEYRLMRTMSPEELAQRSVGGVHYRRPDGLAWGTYEYVSKMRALTCLLAQPQRQSIPLDPTVPITHWVPFTLPADVDSLDELASRLGTDAEQLKAFNHGYRNGRIEQDAPRTVLVPASTRPRWAAAGAPVQGIAATATSATNVTTTTTAPAITWHPTTTPSTSKTSATGVQPILSMVSSVSAPAPKSTVVTTVPPPANPSTPSGAAVPANTRTSSSVYPSAIGPTPSASAAPSAVTPIGVASPTTPAGTFRPPASVSAPALPASAPTTRTPAAPASVSNATIPPSQPATQPSGSATTKVAATPSVSPAPTNVPTAVVPSSTASAADATATRSAPVSNTLVPSSIVSAPASQPPAATVPLSKSSSQPDSSATTASMSPPRTGAALTSESPISSKPSAPTSVAEQSTSQPPAAVASASPGSSKPPAPTTAAGQTSTQTNITTARVSPQPVVPAVVITEPTPKSPITTAPVSSASPQATKPTAVGTQTTPQAPVAMTAASPTPTKPSVAGATTIQSIAPTPTVTAAVAAPWSKPSERPTQTSATLTTTPTVSSAPSSIAASPAMQVPKPAQFDAAPARTASVAPSGGSALATGTSTAITPANGSYPATPQGQQAATSAVPQTHKVRLGDSLELIAQRFNLKVDDLRAWNHLGTNTPLYVDQVLKLEP